MRSTDCMITLRHCKISKFTLNKTNDKKREKMKEREREGKRGNENDAVCYFFFQNDILKIVRDKFFVI